MWVGVAMATVALVILVLRGPGTGRPTSTATGPVDGVVVDGVVVDGLDLADAR